MPCLFSIILYREQRSEELKEAEDRWLISAARAELADALETVNSQ